MDDRKLSGCGATQIDDLPPCLMIDILSRLPIEALTRSRFVCKSWFLLFSDPMFVRLHSARSPTCLLVPTWWTSELKRDFKCYTSVGGKDFEIDIKLKLPDSSFWYVHSCRGLLCLSTGSSDDEIYVCNPILGEYITIPIVKSEKRDIGVNSVLRFCSRSNRFKVLQVYYDTESAAYMAEIYTIGDGTREWKSIGIAPTHVVIVPHDSVLNGSIHWADGVTRQIVYFDFESEQFGSFPLPPPFCHGRRWSRFMQVSVYVIDGCLCIYAFGYGSSIDGKREILEKWVMKEYGVEESWTAIFSTQNNRRLNSSDKYYAEAGFPNSWETTTYNPSFISLQDVARSENVTKVYEDEKQVGFKYEVSEEKARTLGANFTPLEGSVKDTIESFKEMGKNGVWE